MTNIEINLPDDMDIIPDAIPDDVHDDVPAHITDDILEVTPPSNQGWWWLAGIVAGIVLILVGMSAIFFSASLDYLNVKDKPWSTAFVLFDIPADLPELESYPVSARRVFRPESLEDDITLQMLEKVVSWERFDQPLHLSDPELLIALDVSAEQQAELLASGRLPEPGKPEVLAGSLARDEAFWIDDVQFTITGRLADSVSGFLFSYMLPHASDFGYLFPDAPNTARGLLVISGETLLEEGILPDNPRQTSHNTSTETAVIEEDSNETDADKVAKVDEPLAVPPYTGGMLLAQQNVAKLSIFGLLLTALGGAVAHFSLFRLLQVRGCRPLQAILDMIASRPSLYWGMHVLFYGVFFLSMYESISNPLLTYRITQYIQAVFSDGGLGYIGEAYASGDVIAAAWPTFYNNYIEQTLGLTFMISLFPIPFGLIKNLMSFSLVGGALTPLWVGTSQAYILHSLTMVFELQGYIIACFAITAWPLHLIAGMRLGQFFSYVKSGLLMLFTAAILTGLMLGIAALYEAFTLIHLMGA